MHFNKTKINFVLNGRFDLFNFNLFTEKWIHHYSWNKNNEMTGEIVVKLQSLVAKFFDVQKILPCIVTMYMQKLLRFSAQNDNNFRVRMKTFIIVLYDTKIHDWHKVRSMLLYNLLIFHAFYSIHVGYLFFVSFAISKSSSVAKSSPAFCFVSLQNRIPSLVNFIGIYARNFLFYLEQN